MSVCGLNPWAVVQSYGVSIPSSALANLPHLAVVSAKVRSVSTGGSASQWHTSSTATVCAQAPTVTGVTVLSVNAHGVMTGSDVVVSWSTSGAGCPLSSVSLVSLRRAV